MASRWGIGRAMQIQTFLGSVFSIVSETNAAARDEQLLAFTFRAGCKERDVAEDRNAGPVKDNALVWRLFSTCTIHLPLSIAFHNASYEASESKSIQ